MAYQYEDNEFIRTYEDDDFLDEDNLIELPCEFCNALFPMLLLMEHQTACRPDLARVVEPAVEEVNLTNLEDPIEDEKLDPLIVNMIRRSMAKEITSTASKEKEPVNKFIIQEENQEVIEEALLQENEAFSLGSSNKEKIVEEEKLSFEHPPNPLLNTHNSKQCIHNDLTESDNEDNESLEEFWKRAEIKLVQRERWLQKNSLHPK